MSCNAIAKQIEEMYAIAFIIVSLEIEQNENVFYPYVLFSMPKLLLVTGGTAVFRHWKDGLQAHRTCSLANKLY